MPWSVSKGIERLTNISFSSSRGTLYARRPLNLYLAFLISAGIHYLGDYAWWQNWSGGSVKFSMLQPVAITLEHTVYAPLRRTGVCVPTWISRSAYLWVLCWFTITLPIWVEPVVREGFLEDGWHLPAGFAFECGGS